LRNSIINEQRKEDDAVLPEGATEIDVRIKVMCGTASQIIP
jgi:hypothetical protein